MQCFRVDRLDRDLHRYSTSKPVRHVASRKPLESQPYIRQKSACRSDSARRTKLAVYRRAPPWQRRTIPGRNDAHRPTLLRRSHEAVCDEPTDAQKEHKNTLRLDHPATTPSRKKTDAAA